MTQTNVEQAAVQLLDECRGNLEVAQAEIEHLKTALSSARRIGAAMGIVMAAQRITDDDAFEVLREASQRRNEKVRDIAEDVILTGAVPQ